MPMQTGLEGLNKIKLLVYALLERLDLYQDITEEEYNVDGFKFFAHKFLIYALALFPFACPDQAWMQALVDGVLPSEESIADISTTAAGNFGMGGTAINDPTMIQVPLHLAIDRSFAGMYAPLPQTDMSKYYRRMTILVASQNIVVQCLLTMFPAAAKMLMKLGDNDENANARGTEQRRTPLCHAISKGLWWNGGEMCPNGNGGPIGPIQALIKAAPEAVETRDTVSALYPFMLAATIMKRTKDEDEVKAANASDESRQELYQLSTVYGLLRTCPQVLDQIYDQY